MAGSQHYGILEAEAFTRVSNFELRPNGLAVQAIRGDRPSVMTQQVTGVPGVYDLVVYYWDENDGVARSSISIDGVTVDSWSWSRDLGSAFADTRTYTQRVIRNVTLDDDATIRFEGQPTWGELLRVDKMVLTPAADRDLRPGLPAFPGAEGFGSDTPGGRGGWVVKVTNLNDSGPGSLRWALQDLDVPRIVVFDVGGVIDLRSEIYVRGDVTVAGQTAPGEGVVIRGGRLQVVGDNVVIRGLKIRPGDGPGQDLVERDAISIGTVGRTVSNVLIDSNSFAWAPDEVASIWGSARNVTFSNNIIAEGLAIPSIRQYSFGMIVGDDGSGAARSQNVSMIGNLISTNEFRSPVVSNVSGFEFINNLVYNYGTWALQLGRSDRTGEPVTAHVIGNAFIPGPISLANHVVKLDTRAAGNATFLRDNLGPYRMNESQPESDIAFGALTTLRSSPIFASSGATAIPAAQVLAETLATVGARGQGLDAVDARILANVVNGTGRIVTSPSAVGGYQTPTVRTTLADTDGDGIPDVYEALIGSDRFVFDPHGDATRNGYSNIEDYINGLLDGRFAGLQPPPAAPSPPAAPPPQPPAATPLVVEAEAMQLVQGFVTERNIHASGGTLIRSSVSGDAEARHVFQGATGRYDMVVRHVDENDGAARLAVRVGGVTVDEWVWNRNLGSAFVTPETITERVIPNVALTNGQTIALVGRGDAGEPLRIDQLRFTPASQGPAPLLIEAEAMQLVSGFTRQSFAFASGGGVIESHGSATAVARAPVNLPDGRYNIHVRHYDENDGQARLSVRVDGRQVDEWVWNRDLAGPTLRPEALVDRVIPSVALRPGSTIELVGRGDAGEPLRIDSLLLVQQETLF